MSLIVHHLNNSRSQRILWLLEEIGAPYQVKFYDRDPVTNWTRGRVTLLGDAAHPTLQYLAQGANMAIEDGVALAEKVAAAGTDHPRAFLAYQRERLNRTARVVLSSRFFGEYFHVDGGARELRNELARQRDPENPWEIDWLYRGIEVDGRLY